MTPNQLVAWNLREARRLRGWSQEEAAERLEAYLGERWSRTTFSAAEEGTISGRRVRQFTADHLIAFSQAFNVPVLWFLLPPSERAWISMSKGERELLNPEDYLTWLFTPDFGAVIDRRIRQVIQNIPHPSLLQEWLATLDSPRAILVREVLNAHLLNVRERADELRRMAGELEEALGELDQQHGIKGQSSAEQITEFVTSLPDEFAGEPGKRRLEKEMERVKQSDVEEEQEEKGTA